MRQFVTLFSILCILFLFGCGPDKPKIYTPEQIKQEKESILNLMKLYNKASEEKSWLTLVGTLSKDIVFFGTDSSETINTITEFQRQMNKQWSTYKTMKYGEVRDVSIHMDQEANWASVIFGVPVDIQFTEDSSIHYFFRIARTLKKEDNKWVIVSGIAGIVSQSSPTVNIEIEKVIK